MSTYVDEGELRPALWPKVPPSVHRVCHPMGYKWPLYAKRTTRTGKHVRIERNGPIRCIKYGITPSRVHAVIAARGQL